MKIKLLTTIIAGVLLVGCGGNDNSVDDDKDNKNTKVLAFDGAINGMVANYICADGTSGTTATKTDGYGFVTIISNTFANQPETCSLLLNVPKDSKAVDMSNNKDMSNVTYAIPQGLLVKGQKIAATPFTTLIDKAIKQSGETNPENIDINAIIAEVFSDLKITVDPIKLMSDPIATLATLDDKTARDILAKTMVLSDILVTHKDDKSISTTNIAAATVTVAANVITNNTEFPIDKDSGYIICIDLTDELADKGNFNAAASGNVPSVVVDANTNPTLVPEADLPDPENPPVDPTPEPVPPPTGGTGGDDGQNPNG